MTYSQHSAYIKLATGEYPFYEGHIRLEHPEIPETATWPNFPCPETYAVVPWEPAPAHNQETHCAYQTSPVLVDGQWKIQWAIRAYTQEELDEFARMKTEAETDIANAFTAADGDTLVLDAPPAPEFTVEDIDIQTTITPLD